jgi:hypothetical protein
MRAKKHGILVRRKVQDTIGYDHVETGRLKAKLVELFDVAPEKTHVVEAEDFPVKRSVPFGHGELFPGHVHAHHFARAADQLRQYIRIPPRAAAKIEHSATFQQRWADQPTAVITRQDFRMDARQERPEPVRGLSRIAAGAGLQVSGML